jgi:hypothetical protein
MWNAQSLMTLGYLEHSNAVTVRVCGLLASSSTNYFIESPSPKKNIIHIHTCLSESSYKACRYYSFYWQGLHGYYSSCWWWWRAVAGGRLNHSLTVKKTLWLYSRVLRITKLLRSETVVLPHDNNWGFSYTNMTALVTQCHDESWLISRHSSY